MNKREIKAHKGGRTEKKEARLTPEEKAQLDAELEKRGISFSDWTMSMLQNSGEPLSHYEWRRKLKTALLDKMMPEIKDNPHWNAMVAGFVEAITDYFPISYSLAIIEHVDTRSDLMTNRFFTEFGTIADENVFVYAYYDEMNYALYLNVRIKK